MRKEQVGQKIAGVTDTHYNIFRSWFLGRRKAYHGTIGADGFELQRDSGGMNWSMIVIKGIFKPEFGMHLVTITIWPGLSLFFLPAIGSVIIFFLAQRLVAAFLDSGLLAYDHVFLIGISILLFLGVPLMSFNQVSNHTIRFFQDLLEVNDVQETGFFNRNDLT